MKGAALPFSLLTFHENRKKETEEEGEEDRCTLFPLLVFYLRS